MNRSDDLISRQAAIDATAEYLRDMAKIDNPSLPMSIDGWKPLAGKILDKVPSAQPEIIRCKECIYYDTPHIEDKGERREYKDMPEEAFDKLGTGLVSMEYGINVGGRCTRDYHAGYSEDKRVFVGEDNYCGRAERRTDEQADI